MVVGLLQLVLCQLVGEFIAKALRLPIPGPVIGMVVLFGLLLIRAPKPESDLIRAADGLLKHLQLLFIPVGVGVIEYRHVLVHAWLPVVGGLVVAWLAALAATAGAAAGTVRLEARLSRRTDRRAGQP